MLPQPLLNYNLIKGASPLPCPDSAPDIVNEDLEMMTGGDILNNGEKILLKSYLDVFQFTRNNDESIIEGLSNEMKLVHYIPEVQGEAICWHPEGFGYFTISEEKMNIESILYFYPKLEGCMDIKANNVREILNKHILADGYDPIIDLKNSHGSWLVDERDNTEYLDMFSMYASGCIGYNHPMIVKNKDLLGKVALSKPTLSDMYTVEYADFLNVFNERTGEK